jgi:hypothetical protein
MPSPFPGMDPWLESPAVFPDFHTRFLTALSAALNAVVPPPFFTAVSTRVYMEASERLIEPDVDVLRPAGVPGAGGGTATLAPVAVELLEVPARPLPDEEISEVSVEVRTADDGNRLVTSIELLSLTNKTRGTSGRGLYLAKQHELRQSGVNLVEIDLLRAGVHATAASLPEFRRRAGGFVYHVSVSRAERWDAAFVAPIALPQRLPVIPVPLTGGVADVPADLQAVLDRTYDEAAYARRVRYDQPPTPPLAPDQQAWAEGILRAKGLIPAVPGGAT